MITVLNQQNQLDLSIQLFGTVESVFNLANKNDISITDDIEAGLDLEVEASDFSNLAIKSYYEKNRILPATKIPNVEGIEEIGKGIGSMKIDFGFVIK